MVAINASGRSAFPSNPWVIKNAFNLHFHPIDIFIHKECSIECVRYNNPGMFTVVLILNSIWTKS